MPRSPIEYLAELKLFYREEARMPSFSEMLGLFGVKSKNAVSRIVHELTQNKLIRRDTKGRLLPGHSFLGIKVLGFIEAGFPAPAEEQLVDTITLDEYLVQNHRDTFMLKVSGDSMIDAGIQPGDLVLLERGRAARNGDIVVAEIDHQWTMKYYEKRNGKVRLVPANKRYKAIIPKERLLISGVVIAVVRKYR
ncbi:repressor LexA [Candidatus Uhrbacteria bacterium]|nr:repressor LexA [Candidatus Uhrbacteria bacterium]